MSKPNLFKDLFESTPDSDSQLVPIIFRTAYDDIDSSKFVIDLSGGKVTQPSHAKNGAMDPNVLFFREDVLSSLTPPSELNYGDFSNVGDYTQAMTQVAQANQAFEELPADLRDYFDNSPHDFVDFMIDPENLDEAISLGLVSAPPAPQPEKTEKVPVTTVKESPTVVEDDLPKAEPS